MFGRRVVLGLLTAGGAGWALQQFMDDSAVLGPSTGELVFLTNPRMLPNVRFLDERGTPTSLEAMRGRVILLNIWATWCPPCRKEMPSLDRLQAQLGGTDFEVVALSIDTGPKGHEAVHSFYTETGVRNLRIYHDPEGKSGFELGVIGVPTSLLLDRAGREIARLTGTTEWDSSAMVQRLREHLGR